jgi:hypothetical protein
MLPGIRPKLSSFHSFLLSLAFAKFALAYGAVDTQRIYFFAERVHHHGDVHNFGGQFVVGLHVVFKIIADIVGRVVKCVCDCSVNAPSAQEGLGGVLYMADCP